MAWLKKKVQVHIDSFRGEKKSGSTDKVNIEIKVQGPDDDLHLSDLESSLSSSQGDFRKLLQQQQQEEEANNKTKGGATSSGKNKVKGHRRGRSDGSIIIKNKNKDAAASMFLVSNNLQNQVCSEGSSKSLDYKGSVGEITQREFTNLSFMTELNKEAEESLEETIDKWKAHRSAVEENYRQLQNKINDRQALLITMVTEYAKEMQSRLTRRKQEQQQQADKVLNILEGLKTETDPDEITDIAQTLKHLPPVPIQPLPDLTHSTKEAVGDVLPQLLGTFQTLKSKGSASCFDSMAMSSMTNSSPSSVVAMETDSSSRTSSISSPMSPISAISTSSSGSTLSLLSRPEYLGTILCKTSKDTRECGITDMAFTDDRQVIAVDKHNKLVKVFQTNGTFVKFIGKNVLKEPSRVTVLPWNHNILISDSATQVITIFNTDGAVIGNFASDLSSPVAHCIMPDNKIAVVNFDTKLVSIYTASEPQGETRGEYKKSRSFPTGLDCPAYITCTSCGHLVISDWSANKVRVYDTQGKFIKQVSKSGSGQGQISKPQGVHGDSHGNLFLGEKGNRRIQIFNEDGESTFIMDKKTYDLALPMAMDTTTDGFLIVAEYQGNIKFFRYLDVPITEPLSVRPLTAVKGRGRSSAVSPETFSNIEESDL